MNFAWSLSVTGGVGTARHIIIAFQTGRVDDQEQNPAEFDHLNFKNAFVTLNSVNTVKNKSPFVMTSFICDGFSKNDLINNLPIEFHQFSERYRASQKALPISNRPHRG